MEVELSLVPQRETGMTPYEIMLSESQERMLLVVAKGREAEVRKIFAKWELDAVEIGRVTDDGILRVRMEGHPAAEVPVKALTDAPVFERPAERPAWLDSLQAFDPLSLAEPADYGRALLTILAAPTVASKEWVWRQYDHQVGINTLVLPGSDAAVLRIKGTRKAIAMTTDGNSRYVLLDPRAGAAMAVAEAARNLTCAGASPLAVTDGLNFGSPERPEILWQFAQAVEGIAEACRVLDIPVVSGNVSFYNETQGRAILPTPIIGMVGLLEEAERRMTQWFKEKGDRIALLGPDAVSLGGSEYLWTLWGKVAGPLAPLDLTLERAVQAACRTAIEAGLCASAHDCSEGGLAVALAEACITGPALLGAEIVLPPSARADLTLFGEGPSRIVVSVPRDAERHFEGLMREWRVPCHWIGTVGGERLVIRIGGQAVVDFTLEQLSDVWRNGFARHVA
jgi:phosphoribosylformylglycinamidine synthase